MYLHSILLDYQSLYTGMVKKTSLAYLRGICVRSDAGIVPPDDLHVPVHVPTCRPS